MRYSKYLVKQGDNLYKIANKFGVSVEDLINANSLNSNVIYPNQVLIIPTESIQNEIIVQYGDSIKDLMERYDLDLNDLMDLKIVPEQVIMKRSKVLRIDNEESLEDILRKNNLTSDELLRLNQNRWLKSGLDITIR